MTVRYIGHPGRAAIFPDRPLPVIRADADGYATGHYLNDGSGRSMNVVNFKTRRWETKHYNNWLPHMCCMGDHGSRVSVAFSVWCLIADYHSIMDSWPRWENWEAIF